MKADANTDVVDNEPRKTDFFLKTRVLPVDEISVVVSKRIIDEQNNPVPFRFKSVGTERINDLRTECQKPSRDTKGRVVGKEFDGERFMMTIAIESCVYPDFRNPELIKSWGVKTPEQLVREMLSIEGEFNRFTAGAFNANEIGEDFDELVTEAKN